MRDGDDSGGGRGTFIAGAGDIAGRFFARMHVARGRPDGILAEESSRLRTFIGAATVRKGGRRGLYLAVNIDYRISVAGWPG